MSVKWYCKRCAAKADVKIEEEPMILRVCSACEVENYCYPAGHAGEDVEAEVVVEAESTDEIEVIDEPIEEALEVVSEPSVEEEKIPVKPPEPELTEEEKKIADLEAQIAALKGG